MVRNNYTSYSILHTLYIQILLWCRMFLKFTEWTDYKPMLSCRMWACGNTGLYQIPCIAYSIENRDSHCSIIDSLPGALDAL